MATTARRSGNPAVRSAAKKAPAKPSAKTKTGTFSLARYREEATGAPFPLELDDGEVIEIPRPTGDVIMAITEKMQAGEQNVPIKELLGDLLGDHYDKVMPIIGAEDFQVMIRFMEDLSEHFGLGEAVASLG